MRRPPTRLLAALALGFALTACGTGGGDATQGGIRDQVRDRLLDRTELPESDPAHLTIDRADAENLGTCVADEVFASGEFDKDDRNDAARAVDGEAPDAELVAKVEAVMRACDVPLPGDEPADPEDEVDGCLAAFEDAAEVDEFESSPSDYFPTLTACDDLDAWTAAAERTEARLDLDAPAEAVANLCEGADESSPLCEEATADG